MPAIADEVIDHGVERLASIHFRGVDLRPWPSLEGSPELDGPRTAAVRPVLHLVSAGAAPPPCPPLEDWVRVPCDDDELIARVERLALRSLHAEASTATVDDDGVLRIGDRLVVLSGQEARLLKALLDRFGDVVSREEVHEAVWGSGMPESPRALDNRVKALRERLAGLPIEIHTLRGRGLLVDVALPT